MGLPLSRQCDRYLAVDGPARLNSRVVRVQISIVEFLVKQIRRADGSEPIALGQTVTEGGIDDPKCIVTCCKAKIVFPLEFSLLIIVNRVQTSAQSGRVIEAGP